MKDRKTTFGPSDGSPRGRVATKRLSVVGQAPVRRAKASAEMCGCGVSHCEYQAAWSALFEPMRAAMRVSEHAAPMAFPRRLTAMPRDSLDALVRRDT